MNRQNDDIFNMILASTVHDMKNSLSMLGESLNIILSSVEFKKLSPQATTHTGVVQYESARVNNSLMQLLALYKLENEQLPFNPNYMNLGDFLEEQRLRQLPLLEAKRIQCEIDVDDELEGVFDECLLSTVLENIIGNAIRYSRSKILIECIQSDTTVITVNDDGPGYPEIMIEMAGSYMQGINHSTGSTGLGLFFAQKIADIHSHKGKQGSIKLSNGGKLGGGVFEICIP
ncbi:MAG: HAMP domain-containing histidine kinase [Kangiellaceae bacterium]|nr:HAMP domain-containing histidine kinase [Kangiellaceae bacterium]